MAVTNNEKEIQILDLLADDVNEYAKLIGVNVGTELIKDMPVDTGRARSNVRLYAPYDNKYERRPYLAYPEGSGPNKSETANERAAIGVLERDANKLKPFKLGFIVNNATDQDSEDNYYYAVDLEEGSSKQTPAGMIDRSIKIGLVYADNAMSFYLKQPGKK